MELELQFNDRKRRHPHLSNLKPADSSIGCVMLPLIVIDYNINTEIFFLFSDVGV